VLPLSFYADLAYAEAVLRLMPQSLPGEGEEPTRKRGVGDGMVFAGSPRTMLATSVPVGVGSLGPAMQFVLSVAWARTFCVAMTPEWRRLTEIWDLAERFHPEETWWASTYLGGGRDWEELTARAPRNVLAPALRQLSDAGVRLLLDEASAVSPLRWAGEPRPRASASRSAS